MKELLSDWGGRRFLLCVGCAAVCTYLLVNEHMSDNVFRDIIIATLATYIAGNTVQKIKADNELTYVYENDDKDMGEEDDAGPNKPRRNRLRNK